MTNNVRPQSIAGDFFIGTNSKYEHLLEALHQQVVAPDEILLGFFDGIFFDAAGKRVGGLALNDYLVITNNRFTLWARDQFKDVVDHFPLSHVFVLSQETKDSFHGTLVLNLVLPNEDLEELEQAEKVKVTFDFVPLPDLKLLADIVTALGNAQREMLVSGASDANIAEAIKALFEKNFVEPHKPATPPQPKAPPVNNYATQGYDPSYGIVNEMQESELDAFMTPLSRLDRLDGSAGRQNGYRGQRQVEPQYYASNNNHSTQEVPMIGGVVQYLNNSPADLASEMRGRGNGGRTRRATMGDLLRFNTASAADGGEAIGRQDAHTTEGVYMLARVGRTAWDGLNKIAKEAEAKALPPLQSLRDSGMNLKEVTEFLTAANGLLETVGRNPAAKELAMAFLNRLNIPTPLSGLGKSKPRKVAPIDDAEELTVPVPEDSPSLQAVPVGSKALKVERRKSSKDTQSNSVKTAAATAENTVGLETPNLDVTLDMATESLETKMETSATIPETPVSGKVVHRLAIRTKGRSQSETDELEEEKPRVRAGDLSILRTDKKPENHFVVPDGPALN